MPKEIDIYNSGMIIGFDENGAVIKRLLINGFGTDKQRRSNWPYAKGGDYFYPQSISKKHKRGD